MKKGILLLAAVLLLMTGCREALPEEGWTQTTQGLSYLDQTGTPLVGWQTVDGRRCYFDPDRDGTMVTGWLDLPEGRYYFDGMGTLHTGWLELPEGCYYFDGTGALHTGWLELPEGIFYMDSEGAMAVGTVTIDGVTHHFTSAGAPFLLVNRKNPLPDNYQANLTELEGFQVAAECAAPLKAMMEACRAAGHRCVINSAYRDVEFQQMLWDNRYNGYIAQGYSPEEAADLSAQIVLPPGTSEHHTGLAIDITGTDQMYRWLAEHAPEYGFILRYPQDKTQWTGVMYEPWHFRYVGVELAHELQALGLTPEEYLHQLTKP